MRKWADEVGDQSYTYENVVEYYRKSMNFTPPDMETRLANSTPSYDENDTATGGPLDVIYPAYSQSWSTWVAKALEAVGMTNTNSFINGNLIGSAWQLDTVQHHNGYRESAETAFLTPYLSRPNLSLFNGTLAERIIFANGTVASGVEVTTANTTYTLTAKREVIVSGGVFQSPQLLQVSGIGPAAVLEKLGIPVVADRPGVGHGMNDHVFFGIGHKVNVVTSTMLSYGDNLEIAIAEFNANGTGPLSSPGGDFCGNEKIPEELRANFSSATNESMFLSYALDHLWPADVLTTNAALAEFPDDWPEIQYLVLPSYVGDLESTSISAPRDGYNYATILATLVAPSSRGNLSISSSRMSDQPLINPNWLTEQSDIELVISAFRRLRQIFASAPLTENVLIGEEFYPGPSVQTDEEIYEQIKKSFNAMYHAASTCKMGKPDDEYAVVDTNGRVYGVENCWYLLSWS